jgi:lipoprotein-anchoring transpeptidase ErfK/SrfK
MVVRMVQLRRLAPALMAAFAIVVTGAASLQASSAPPRHARPRPPAKAHPVQKKEPQPPRLECGDYVAFQVLLDRQGFSPGQIDGKPGANFMHALAALQGARHIPVTGEPDCATWHAMGGETAAPPIVAYTLTDADLEGPFVTTLPTSLPEQAKLPALGYTSALERLGERFHSAPALLQRLNPDVRFAANTEIMVPAVDPFDFNMAKPMPDPAAAELTVTVTRDESALRVTRADGSLVFFAPVTTGSEHDPLPVGDWKVTGVEWHPVFHYNPNLFWDAKATDTSATLKPGPNNPVGTVWIDVNIPHYGIHGTPEPGNIGHTESHGCVRMTNWDAARLAGLVQAGTVVLFR